MFFSERVTVAVSCSLSCASEISVSYSSTAGFTMIDRWGPAKSCSGS